MKDELIDVPTPEFGVQTKGIEPQKCCAWGQFQIRATTEAQLYAVLAALHNLSLDDLLQLSRR